MQGSRVPGKNLFMLYGRVVYVGETLTYLQILGCELDKNAFVGRAGGTERME